MEWGSFLTGVISTAFAFALFTSDKEEVDEFEIDGSESESDLVVNDFSSRHVTLSCQTCRKLKKHKEIKSNLYQCTKCKRHVDLRAS